jgi:hypothetical protein
MISESVFVADVWKDRKGFPTKGQQRVMIRDLDLPVSNDFNLFSARNLPKRSLPQIVKFSV